LVTLPKRGLSVNRRLRTLGNFHVMDLSARAVVAVTSEGQASTSPPNWSPDGQQTLYAGEFDLFLVDATDGPSVGLGQWPGVSSCGRRSSARTTTGSPSRL
jgi:hypothetical protein